jgi:hypothetical protein
MSVYRDLEPVPAALESAHAERNQSATKGTLDRKVRTA